MVAILSIGTDVTLFQDQGDSWRIIGDTRYNYAGGSAFVGSTPSREPGFLLQVFFLHMETMQHAVEHRRQ
jgi:hypothetical protein